MLFIWQFFIHMVSGIYHDTFIELKDPVAVETVIKENIPEGSTGGMLLLPYAHPKNASEEEMTCLLYTSPSPRDRTRSRMPSSA